MREGADVVYALFSSRTTRRRRGGRSGERCIDWAVRTFQPTPAMTHVELLMPPVPRDEADRTQFATYAGRTAAWQSDRVDGFAFYLHHNANLWRAVPVFAPNAATAVRAECDLEQGVGYSLATYLTGVAPLRWVARFLTDARRTPAHCATLTARVLKNALGATRSARSAVGELRADDALPRTVRPRGAPHAGDGDGLPRHRAARSRATSRRCSAGR